MCYNNDSSDFRLINIYNADVT